MKAEPPFAVKLFGIIVPGIASVADKVIVGSTVPITQVAH